MEGEGETLFLGNYCDLYFFVSNVRMCHTETLCDGFSSSYFIQG